MWRHIDVQVNWRRSSTYGRAPNAIDISLVFFNVPVQAPTRDQPFIKVILRNRPISVAFYGAHSNTEDLFSS